MMIDGKEFPTQGNVYTDDQAYLQANFPKGYAKPGESTIEIYSRWIASDLKEKQTGYQN